MKQILAWPYVLIHTKDDGSSFADKQWDKPLIIRYNKAERQVFLYVDKANQKIDAKIEQSPIELPNTDTEIEITWPIIGEVSLDIHRIEEFCKQYTIFTTDITFQFRLTDNSHNSKSNFDNGDYDYKDEDNSIIAKRRTNDLRSELVNALTSPASRATIKIDAPRLHPILTGWNNISFIHSYKPEEFVTRIIGVHDKHNTSIYDVLRTFREGTNMTKTVDTQITVAEFISKPDRDKRLKRLYYALKKVLPPPVRLSLPYSNIRSNERKKALVERIAQIYGSHNLDSEKAFYKINYDNFDDNKGILHFHSPLRLSQSHLAMK
jgi:hypothetical protein